VRDLRASKELALRAVVSRRSEHATASWKDVLADPAVGAVCICTENALHEPQAREALEAGKHVLVEYPLSLSAKGGAVLFDLADGRGRVLHVEHLELLSGAYAALRSAVRRHGALRQARLHFTGNSDGWIGDRARAGFPSFAGLARLSRLCDLFGDLEVESAHLADLSPGFVLEATLRTQAGAPIAWRDERHPGQPRATSLRFEFEDGEIDGFPPREPSPLFAVDLALFEDELCGRRDARSDRPRILRCLALAEEIERACEGGR
jgi:biliverdin reductase